VPHSSRPYRDEWDRRPRDIQQFGTGNGISDFPAAKWLSPAPDTPKSTKTHRKKPICRKMAPFKPDILHLDVPPQPSILANPAAFPPFAPFQHHSFPDFHPPAAIDFPHFFRNNKPQ
jgi:hypothetical protein